MKLLGWMKPEYLFQPTRLVRRLFMTRSKEEFCEVPLAWGGAIRVRPGDAIAHSLDVFGIYDLALSETLWRLVDNGETVVDVGANIGYTAALMASKVGGAGRVICFEAHPETYQELLYNARRVEQRVQGVRVDCFQVALSDSVGDVILLEPPGFRQSSGSARVVHQDEPCEQGLRVAAARLDETMANVASIGMVKIDVEGYEAHVLRGSQRLLRERRIRDIVFEELGGYPSPASDLLEQAGYRIFEIRKTFLGPEIVMARAGSRRSTWEPQNYLATIADERARARLRPMGWSVLALGVGRLR